MTSRNQNNFFLPDFRQLLTNPTNNNGHCRITLLLHFNYSIPLIEARPAIRQHELSLRASLSVTNTLDLLQDGTQPATVLRRADALLHLQTTTFHARHHGGYNLFLGRGFPVRLGCQAMGGVDTK